MQPDSTDRHSSRIVCVQRWGTMEREQMRRLRILGVTIVVASFLVSAAHVGAAASFASPAFQTQWQQGESVTPNFWGPLATARDGQQEPYAQAPGGTRLVQYFDKGRMELSGSAVTNGLLATELVKGQLQVGDATFQAKDPPAIPIAGDPDNPGPTYAQLAAKAKAIFDAAPQQMGNATQAAISSTGDVAVSTASPSTAATFAVFDGPTKHNVPRAFTDYRTKAGLQTIGYAISEPFWTTVKVAGTLRQVLAQVFERRVLTYTATNPAAFQVEMGNVGQHYYQWRYAGSGALTAQDPSASTISPAATPTKNWAGYAVDIHTVTAVHATWIVPALTTPPATGYSGMWVGIGGTTADTSDSLIQAGTLQFLEDGETTYRAWVQTLPDELKAVSRTRLSVAPGDIFSVTIANTSGDTWDVTLENRTTQQTLSVSTTYTSCKCSAEWIAEAPEIDGNDEAPLANFGVVSFTEATATIDGATRSLGALNAKPYSVRQHQKIVAQPQAPGGDGMSFTVTYVP
jgi:hypothetical protein